MSIKNLNERHKVVTLYYTALLNAVECSIHLNGPSQRSAVGYFRMTDRC